MNLYPSIKNSDNASLKGYLEKIVEERKVDVSDYNNMTVRFLLGRKTHRMPSSSADVLATDREGDIFATDTYLYILVNVSGTLVWRRAALGAW